MSSVTVGRGRFGQGKVLLLTGPAAAGKTTIAHHLAAESSSYVVLLPPFEVIRERSRGRPSHERHSESTLARIYGYFGDLRGREGHVIDSVLDPDATLTAIRQRLLDGSLALS